MKEKHTAKHVIIVDEPKGVPDDIVEKILTSVVGMPDRPGNRYVPAKGRKARGLHNLTPEERRLWLENAELTRQDEERILRSRDKRNRRKMRKVRYDD